MKVTRFAAFLLALVALVAAAGAHAQSCSALLAGPANWSGIVNTYYPGTSSLAPAGSMSIGVGTPDGRGAATPIAAGDLLLIIQLQDASISTSNSSAYGGSVTGGGYTSLNSSGLFEYAVAAGPVSLGSVPLSTPLINTYRSANANSIDGQKRYQVIRVPQASSATLTGNLTAPPWNGSTGGIVAIDVAGNLSWGGRTIDVSGRGFRGGGGQWSTSDGTGPPTNAITDYVSNVGNGTLGLGNTAGTVPNGAKGEGIAGTPIIVFQPTTPNDNNAGTVVHTGGTDGVSGGYPQGSFGRGAPGNAGGGGTDGNVAANDENTGGAGGGNYGQGGMGGYGWTPGIPPGWDGGGVGGAPVPGSATRLFFGGGGGAGTTNNRTGTPGNGAATSGAAGGGMIFVRAGSTTGTATLNARGTDANTTITNDASGGGGAGGSVLVFVDNGGAPVGAVINIQGGRGGDNTGGGSPHGPGGGGSGGFAILSGTATVNASGGDNGLTAPSPTSTVDYGSTSSVGGFEVVSLTASQIPGAGGQRQCFPQLTVQKSTSTPFVSAGGTATYTITVSNLAGRGSAQGVTISDPLPHANITYASTPSVVLGGGATRSPVTNPTAGTNTPSWGTFNIPGGGSVQLTFHAAVGGAVPTGTYQNPANVTYLDPTRTASQTVTPGGTYTAGGTVPGSNYVAGSTSNEDITVATAPTLAKSFNPASASVGATSTLTVTIGNPSTVALTNVGLVDNYPPGMVNAAAPGAATTCAGGSVTAAPSGIQFTLANASIPPGGSCTVTVNVTSTAPGPYTNTLPAGALTNAQNLTNVTPASATLFTTVRVVKSFSPPAVSPNNDATLSLDLVNDNTGAVSLANPGLTDIFPAGLVATGGPVTVTGAGCAGFSPATVAAGATSLALTAGTIPAGGTCRVSIAVRSAVNGIYANTSSGVTTTDGATGPVSNTANLGVGVINISKAFSPATIVVGGTSTVTLTLDNPTGVPQTAGSFEDNLVGMTVAGNQVTGGTCGLAQPLANGQSAITFAGINIPAGSCTITFTVTSASVGAQANTAGGVITSLLSRGPASNTAILNVIDRPTIAKAFAPSTINPGGTSTLTFTLTNPGPVPLSGVSFTDTYPANVVNATPLTVGGSCTGVTHTATAGGNTFNVTAGNLPVASSCTITVLVTANTVGSYDNQASGVTTAQTASAGAGSPSNVATLAVATAPGITKAFGTGTIAQGGTSLVTFTISNPNTVALTNVQFSDTLANMALANGTIGGTCAGTGATPALGPGSTNLNFTIPSIAAGASCTVTVTVTSSTSGTHPNTTTGVTSAQTPVAGAPSNTANLTVLAPPQLTKGFIPAAIQVGGTTQMRFTLTNPNAVALTNVSFSDALVNMALGAAPGIVETCAGSVTPVGVTAGSANITLTLNTLNAGETCTITISPVTSGSASPAAGHANTTSPVTSTQTAVNPGAAATANLLVYAPPVVTKAFTPSTVTVNATSTITFTVTNPNPVALSGITFTDDLPTNMSNNAAQTFVGPGRGTCTTAIPQSKAAGVADPINFASINLGPGQSCTVMMNVTASAAGFYTNTVTNITSNQTPTPVTGGSDTLTVGARMVLTETFTPASVVVGEQAILRWTIDNNNAGNNQANIDLASTLPAGLAAVGGAATRVNVAGSCTFPASAPNISAGATSITLNNFITDMDIGDICAIQFPVVASAPGDYAVTVTAPPAGNPTSIDNATDTATLIVYASPTIAKAFSPATIAAGGTSTVTLTLANGHPTRDLTNASFTDTLVNMSVAGDQAVGGTCVGTTPANLANGATNLSFSGITIPAGGACTVTFTVTSNTVGTHGNTTSGVTTTQTTAPGAASNTAQLTVAGIAVTKAFDVASRPVGLPARLTITLASPQAVDWTGLAFTDTLPANLVVANPANATTSCGAGTVTATPGSNVVALAGGAMPIGASPCTVAVDVVSTVPGTYTNQAANFSGGSPGLGFAGASASIQYFGNAALGKAFVPATIGPAGTSVLTFTLQNGAGNPAQAGLAFTDTLPAGVVIAATPGVQTNCPAGGAFAAPGFGVTAAAGTDTIAVTGAAMNPGVASCQVRVNVTAANVGSYANTSANISGLSGGLTAGGASATLDVVGVALTKAFTPASVAANAPSPMRFTITNGSGNPAQAGIAFTDTLPTNVVVANPPNASHTCAAGTFAPAAGATAVTFTGGAMSSGMAACEVVVDVVSAVPGSYTNAAANVGATPVWMDKSGVNATLTVLAGPTASKAFGAAYIAAGGTTTLTFTFNNANAVDATGLAFADAFPTMPGAMTLADTTASNTCGGTLTDNLGGALGAGDAGIALAGGTIPAGGSCAVTVNVTAIAPGVYTNTLPGGTITTANAGAVGTPTQATITVLAPPAISKAFSGPIGPGGTATLTFQVTNPNAGTALTGVAFGDTFPTTPAAMVVGAAPAATTNNCGTPTFTPAANDASITFSGGTIAPGDTCTVTVDVTAPTPGTYSNTSGAVTASGPVALSGGTASASLTVAQATLTKAFSPATIAANATSTLTFTIANATGNPGQAGLAFTDTLPAGLAVAGTPNVQTDCPAGDGSFAAPGFTVNATGNAIAASGIALDAGAASCRIRVDVTAALGGGYTNGAANMTGLVRLANGVTDQVLTVSATAPTIGKAFSPATIAADGTSTITFTLTNPNAFALTAGAFTDTLAQMSIAANGAAGGTCAGASGNNFTAGQTTLSFAGLTVPAGTGTTPGSCTVTIAVTSDVFGTRSNQTTTGLSSAEAPTGPLSNVANLTVTAAPATIAKAFSPATIGVGETSTLTFTLSNTNGAALTGASFTDPLANMSIAGAQNAGGTCAGAASNAFTAGQAALSFSGLTIPPNASCTVTVTVTSATVGTHPNTASGVATNEAATGPASAAANLTVTAAAPSIAKAFGPNAILAGETSTLTITITNPNAAPITVTSVTDTFPSAPGPGLFRAPTPNTGTTCAGGVVSSTMGSVTLTGGTVPANGSCTFQVDVTGPPLGNFVNTIPAGALTTSAGANTAPASATLNITPQANVAIANAGPATVNAGAPVTYTVVITNAGPSAADGATFASNVPAAITGVGASCGAATGGAACGAVSVVGNAVTGSVATLPAGGSVTITISGTASAVGLVTTTATVSPPPGTPDPEPANNTASVDTTIVGPDLTLAKTHVGDFTIGGNGTYTLVVSNAPGAGATSGTITVTDTLPAGLAFVSAGGTGWSCGHASGTVTCTTANVIAAGASANAITLTVAVGPTAAPAVTNFASVSGGGEPAGSTANNLASDYTLVVSPGVNTFAPDNARTTGPGTTVFYAHTFTAGSAGTVGFSTSAATTPAVPGWTQLLYRDTDCSGTLNGTENAAQLTGVIAVTAGQSVCIIVVDNVPASAPYNAQAVITVTATFNGTQAIARTDVTTVSGASGAGLALTKSVRNVTQGGAAGTAGTARPNDVLEYTVTYENTGGGPITQIVINDATPAFTTFESAACGPLPTGITGCTVTTQPAVGGTGGVTWTLAGSLASGNSGVVTYQVRVAP